MPHSIQFQVANSRTSGKLKRILRSARKRGDGYDQIARCLYAEHGVEITSNTLRTWAREWGFEPLLRGRAETPRIPGDGAAAVAGEPDPDPPVPGTRTLTTAAVADAPVVADAGDATWSSTGSRVGADDERPEGDEPEHQPAAHGSDGTTEDPWVQEQREKLRG